MRSNRGELLSTVCALGLLVCMFAFAWYGGDGIPGITPRDRLVWTQNAWEALSIVRWAMLATIAVAVGSLILHLNQRSHGAIVVTFRRVIWRFFFVGISSTLQQ